MGSLRQKIEADLAVTLEGDFGLHCPITYSDGSEQIYSANDDTKLLQGQPIYETPEINLDTGETKLVPVTAVTYRRTSLNKIPEPGDRVKISIPVSPATPDTRLTMIATADNQQRHGRSIGIITFYVEQVKQS